jgi:hypothetical protein
MDFIIITILHARESTTGAMTAHIIRYWMTLATLPWEMEGFCL